MGALRTTSAFFVTAAVLLSMAASASAHGNEVHAEPHPPAAGGATPGAIPAVNEPVTGGGAVGGTPAPGAQPAAPTNTLPPVVNGGVGNTGATGTTGNATNPVNAASPAAATKPVDVTKVAPAPSAAGAGTSGSATTTATPKVDLESISEPVTTTVPKTASGGGGGDVIDAGARAVPAGAPVVTGSGNLPFTGIEETILLIALSGMLVPIGVLLYCGARRGDRTQYLRQLAMPRFQWAPAPGVRPDASQWPDARS